MLRPASYRAATARLRRLADQLEARAEASTAQQRRALTLTIHGLSRYAQALSHRHRRS